MAALRGSTGTNPERLGASGLAGKLVTEASKTRVQVPSSQRFKPLCEATGYIEHIILDGLFYLISSILRYPECLLLLCGTVSAPL